MYSDSAPRSNSRSEADEIAWLRFVSMVRQMDPEQLKVVYGVLQAVKAERGRVVSGSCSCSGARYLKVSN